MPARPSKNFGFQSYRPWAQPRFPIGLIGLTDFQSVWVLPGQSGSLYTTRRHQLTGWNPDWPLPTKNKTLAHENRGDAMSLACAEAVDPSIIQTDIGNFNIAYLDFLGPCVKWTLNGRQNSQMIAKPSQKGVENMLWFMQMSSNAHISRDFRYIAELSWVLCLWTWMFQQLSQAVLFEYR